MAVLNIRNIPERLHARLRVRAAEHGRSMEAEARAILTAACEDDDATGPTVSVEDVQAWVDQMYGHAKPAHVVDDLIAERRIEAARE